MSGESETLSAEGGSDLVAVLKYALKQSGQSLNAIARDSGLSQSQLSRFLNDERTLSLESAAKLFIHFKLRIVDENGNSAPVEPQEESEEPPSTSTVKKKPKGKN